VPDRPGQETLDLVQVRHLGPQELATARQEALKLESRAYRVSRVYPRPGPCSGSPGSRRNSLDFSAAPEVVNSR